MFQPLPVCANTLSQLFYWLVSIAIVESIAFTLANWISFFGELSIHFSNFVLKYFLITTKKNSSYLKDILCQVFYNYSFILVNNKEYVDNREWLLKCVS